MVRRIGSTAAAVTVAALSAAMFFTPGTAHAQPAVGEGIVFRVEPGYARWSLDGARIQRQSGVPAEDVQPWLVAHTPDAPSATLVLGYNIKGHATIAAAVSATGWDLGGKDRGGGGLGALEVSWHPAQLVPALAQRRWDVSMFGGAGYGVVGEHRAVDGLHYQVGGRAEAFVTRWLSLGATVRYASLQFDRYVVNWDEDQSVALPQRSGGGLLIPSLTLAVHAPVGY